MSANNHWRGKHSPGWLKCWSLLDGNEAIWNQTSMKGWILTSLPESTCFSCGVQKNESNYPSTHSYLLQCSIVFLSNLTKLSKWKQHEAAQAAVVSGLCLWQGLITKWNLPWNNWNKTRTRAKQHLIPDTLFFCIIETMFQMLQGERGTKVKQSVRG